MNSVPPECRARRPSRRGVGSVSCARAAHHLERKVGYQLVSKEHGGSLFALLLEARMLGSLNQGIDVIISAQEKPTILQSRRGGRSH